jgi:hypothetical protein
MLEGPVIICPLKRFVAPELSEYRAKLWGTPASWFSKSIVTFEQAGTVMSEVLKAIFFATRPMFTAPGGVVVAVAVVVAGAVVAGSVVRGTVVTGAVVRGTVVGGGVMVMVGVGVTGGAGVVHPAARSRETVRRPRRRYKRSCLMTAPVPFMVLNVTG